MTRNDYYIELDLCKTGFEAGYRGVREDSNPTRYLWNNPCFQTGYDTGTIASPFAREDVDEKDETLPSLKR